MVIARRNLIGVGNAMTEKYISCNSASAFKLGFNLKNGLKWRVKHMTLNPISNSYCTIIGGRVGSGNKDFQVTKNLNNRVFGYVRCGNNTNYQNGFYISIFTPYTWIYEAGIVKFEYNGNVVYQEGPFSENLDGGEVPAVGALYNVNGVLSQYWNGEIFSVRCEDSDGVLLCDLKADNINGVWGMKDSVTGTFYTSQTRTPFGGGEWGGGINA